MTSEELIEIASCGETTTVQFKQEFTSQREIAKEMVAFANTRGGRIFFGIKDKTGELSGLSYDEIQSISRELGNAANEQVRPTIYIDTDVVKVEDKRFLICSVARGKNKPYKTISGEIWIKQGTDKRRVTENSEILSLFQDSGAYKPELQPLAGSSVSDLEIVTINEYFEKNFGREKESFGMPLENLLMSQNVLADSKELTLAGAMFFARNPQHFVPAFVIKAVAYYGNDIAGSKYRDSRDISGTIPWMFREAMSFAKSNLHHKQNGRNFNKTGIMEIPEVVLEELIQNSLVHIDLLQPAAIRLLVFENRIEIVNAGCLYGGLEVSDILLGATRQRNPTFASLSGRTMIYRGLGSGILRATRENVKVEFVNNEKTNEFKAIIWRKIPDNNDLSGTIPDNDSLSGMIHDKLNIKQIVVGKLSEKDIVGLKEMPTKSSIDKMVDILDFIQMNPHSSTESISSAVGMSSENAKKYMKRLLKINLVTSEGGNRNRTYSVVLP